MEKTSHILLHLAVPIKSVAMHSILATAVLLGGCNGDPPKSDYLPAKFIHAIPQIPPTRQLRITLPPGAFTTLDFMELHGCALQITLGKYQSRLGRFASDSQRLLLDLEYLNLAPDCIARKQTGHQLALAKQLLQEKTFKLRQLPSRIFNATLANTEFQQFWDKRMRCCDNTDQFRLTLLAISDISRSAQRWLSGDYRASNIEFEIQLSEVAKGSAFYMHSEELLTTLAKFETQLRVALPLEYQQWRELRNAYVQDLFRDQR